MPRRRVKKPPKPVHIMPVFANVVIQTFDQGLHPDWVDFVTKARAHPAPDDEVEYETACEYANMWCADGFAVQVKPGPAGVVRTLL